MESKGKMLEWTGERYSPFVELKISGAEIHYELLHRYYFALHFVKDKKVLDLACGEGYGSYILSNIFSESFERTIVSEKLSRRMRKI